MIARIDSIGRDVATGYIAVQVTYTDEAGTLVNDFLIEVSATVRRPKTDPFGRLLTRSGQWVLPQVEQDGRWVTRRNDPEDPYVRETVEVDQVRQVIDPILSWGAQMRGTSGDRRDPAPKRLAPAAPELAALAGLQFAVPD